MGQYLSTTFSYFKSNLLTKNVNSIKVHVLFCLQKFNIKQKDRSSGGFPIPKRNFPALGEWIL